MPRRIPFACVALVLLTACGCAPRAGTLLRDSAGNAALFGQFRAFDGRTGQSLTLPQIIRSAAAADVILFGEQHSDAVCNQLEAQVLAGLLDTNRPTTLAMEFFETDTQAALDAYLAGRLDETEFRKQTRQNRAYLTAHRPLIELCRAANVPVLAANAPRRLVTAYRKSQLDYPAFCASLDPADRAWLPRESMLIRGPYFERFQEIIKSHPPLPQPASGPASAPVSAPESGPASESQPASAPASQPDNPEQRALRGFRVQLLWDDTMAEWIADYRTRYPGRRVMLVVGSFHVAFAGGTSVKLGERRPADRRFTIVFRGDAELPAKLADADRDAGDVVIYGVSPPEDVR